MLSGINGQMVNIGIPFMTIPYSASIKAISLCYKVVILMMTVIVRVHLLCVPYSY